MKRKPIKPRRKKNTKRTQRRFSRPRLTVKNKRSRKAKRVRRRRSPLSAIQFQSPEHRKALAALRRMRLENASLARATRLEHIKPNTFLRHVGVAVYRSGPGKPWKARTSDTLKARMRILTPKGAVYDVVRSSVERKRLSQYEFALRQFRAGEDGAEQELKKFQGLTVGGHILVTDLNQLNQLEEAGKLDFDELYFAVGDRS